MSKLPVIGTCKLCLKLSVALKESHIISKFLIRESGLLGSRFSINCITNPKKTERFKQDGIKEYLMCDSCEKRLGVWESYARHQFYGHVNPFKTITPRGFMWQGLNYKYMKLFTTSLLWRMGVSKHEVFGHVQLGDVHENRMREMMLTENPMESWRYGCSITFLYYGEMPFPRIFSQPQRFLASKGLNAYRFVLAGFCVMIDAASHPAEWREKDLIYLRDDGSWYIHAMQALSFKFIHEEVKLVRKWKPEND